MARFSPYALAFLAFTCSTNAFTVSRAGSASNTALHGVAPTLIISPIIRKFREEQAKKNAPLASDDEKVGEAPGLRIGKGAWKWPPIFPFGDDMFVPLTEEENAPEKPNPMANMLQQQMAPGTMPSLPDVESMPEVEKFDPKAFWGVDMADKETNLDSRAAEALTNHYTYYLKDGMSVLEFGAAENSYLPENLKLERHVGVSLSEKLMERNAALTQRISVDLNDVITDVGINSAELNELGNEQFDAILMANTVDFLTHPREVYKSAYRLLKPDGIMMVSFSSNDAYEQFSSATTKWWRQFNSDQHTWVTGSFFNFSAGEGWTGLKGFDASPEGAKGVTEVDGPLSMFKNKNDRPKNMYIVQARKVAIVTEIDENDPEKSFASKMWLSPVLEVRDKELVAARLGRIYSLDLSEEIKATTVKNVDVLPKIYECLIKMDQFSFPFGLQAELASNLVLDPSFNANEEQLTALRQGLGLKKPSPEFWKPVGTLTSSMSPEDKVNLLSFIVPRFGSNSPEQELALEAFVTGLAPTFEVISAKCPEMKKADVQLLGTELLASEVLIPGRSTREEYALWLGSLSVAELEEILLKRKALRTDASNDMVKMQEDRKAEEERKEAELQAYREQLEKARKERTMVFDEKTGTMVPIDKR